MESIYVKGNSLPECWEKSLVELWKVGSRFPTEYDRQGDEESKDASLLIHIVNPLQEPRIHRGFFGGLDSLEEYRLEVVEGVHNYFMYDLNNPNRWEYTYNQRFTGHDQIEKCIAILKKCPYSRRAKCEIWDIEADLRPDNEHPPCLQYFTLRIEDNKLNMNGHIRSNDAFRAAYSNLFAVSELQLEIANRLGVGVGSLMWVADSYHIYGSCFEQVKGFLKMVEDRPFEDRVWTSNYALPMFIEGCDKVLSEPKLPADKREKVLQRKTYLENIFSK